MVEAWAGWRSTPPAVFPPVLGLLGLALAWRQGATAFGLGAVLPVGLFLAAQAIYLFCLAGYVARLMSHRNILEADLAVPPKRAGVAAGSACLFACAAGWVPLWPGMAAALLVAGLAVHTVLALRVAWLIARAPDIRLEITPALHLSFVAFILVPLAAGPLGWLTLTAVIAAVTGLAAVVVIALCLAQVALGRVPPPLRPMQAIHVAPPALVGTAAVYLGLPGLATQLAWVAAAALVIVALALPWLTAAGETPVWGSFTFPLAAATGVALLMGPVEPALLWIGGGLLGVASVVIPWIAWRVLRLWPSGVLARQTGAAPA